MTTKLVLCIYNSRIKTKIISLALAIVHSKAVILLLIVTTIICGGGGLCLVLVVLCYSYKCLF